MGWSGGTEYFDPYVDLVLSFVPNKDTQENLIYEWYKRLSDGDWDTPDESDHWELLESILKKREPGRWNDQADDLADAIFDTLAIHNTSFLGKSELKEEIAHLIRESL